MTSLPESDNDEHEGEGEVDSLDERPLRPSLEARLKRGALRAVFAIGVLLALFAAVAAFRTRSEGLRQREVVAALESAGFRVEERSSPSVAWLADLFGEEFFTAPTVIRAGDAAIDDESAARLAELSSLRQIDLGRTKISDATLAKLAGLKNLEALFLQETGVTDEGLASLVSHGKLERLDLSRTGVTGQGLDAVAKLPALRRLWLDETRLDATALPRLGSSPALVYLSLKSTGVAGEPLTSLKELKRLETLYLDDNRLTDDDLAYLADARQISGTLSLAGTSITDASVENLGKFSGVRTLSLERSDMTSFGVERLQRILRTTTILGP